MRQQRGSAVVDFVLVLVVLVPLVLGILQLALVLHVRNTLAAATSEGARYGAELGHTPAEGAGRTRSQIAGSLSGRFAEDVRGRVERTGGASMVVVSARAR